jgi:BirA family transcriptional regulator, biotin operon repressor / biotin---[acetyl-CoA-carboxylase] ligase
VEFVGDLSEAAVAETLPDRPLRVYPAVLSTHADALGWARGGAPEGAVVVAEYQASPRGRGGLEWTAPQEQSVSFSLVLRPRLPLPREGWLYVVGACGVADVVGDDATVAWPDEIRRAGRRAGAVAVQTEAGPVLTEWAVVSVLVEDAPPPRAAMLARVVRAIESRYRSTTVPVLADYLRRCETIGRRVRARLVPLGPAGPAVVGKAVNVLTDGALVVERDDGARVAVRPQNLGVLEEE